jgi:hypothetical protein
MPKLLKKIAYPPLVALLCLSIFLGLTPGNASAAPDDPAPAKTEKESESGISTTTALLIAGGVILVGGGIAIAASNSGGGGGGSSTPAGCACTGDTTVSKTSVTLTALVTDATVRDDDMVVHVKVNGEIVLGEIMLNHSGTSTTINLNKCPATNTITVVAINESDEPPNRGAIRLSDTVSGKPSQLDWSIGAGDEKNWTICTQ